MKTKIFLFTVIALLLLIGESGCENVNNAEENCVFNIDDPINDLEWLKAKIPTSSSADKSIYFNLYQNKKKSQNYFFIEGNINYVITEYSREIIYNCKGDTIMLKGIESIPSEEWNNFFEENILIKQVWPVK
jgi:hypothetical protein